MLFLSNWAIVTFLSLVVTCSIVNAMIRTKVGWIMPWLVGGVIARVAPAWRKFVIVFLALLSCILPLKSSPPHSNPSTTLERCPRSTQGQTGVKCLPTKVIHNYLSLKCNKELKKINMVYNKYWSVRRFGMQGALFVGKANIAKISQIFLQNLVLDHFSCSHSLSLLEPLRTFPWSTHVS